MPLGEHLRSGPEHVALLIPGERHDNYHFATGEFPKSGPRDRKGLFGRATGLFCLTGGPSVNGAA